MSSFGYGSSDPNSLALWGPQVGSYPGGPESAMIQRLRQQQSGGGIQPAQTGGNDYLESLMRSPSGQAAQAATQSYAPAQQKQARQTFGALGFGGTRSVGGQRSGTANPYGANFEAIRRANPQFAQMLESMGFAPQYTLGGPANYMPRNAAGAQQAVFNHTKGANYGFDVNTAPVAPVGHQSGMGTYMGVDQGGYGWYRTADGGERHFVPGQGWVVTGGGQSPLQQQVAQVRGPSGAMSPAAGFMPPQPNIWQAQGQPGGRPSSYGAPEGDYQWLGGGAGGPVRGRPVLSGIGGMGGAGGGGLPGGAGGGISGYMSSPGSAGGQVSTGFNPMDPYAASRAEEADRQAAIDELRGFRQGVGTSGLARGMEGLGAQLMANPTSITDDMQRQIEGRIIEDARNRQGDLQRQMREDLGAQGRLGTGAATMDLAEQRRLGESDLTRALLDAQIQRQVRGKQEQLAALSGAGGALGVLGNIGGATSSKIADIFANTERGSKDFQNALFQAMFGAGGGFGGGGLFG